jgi:microcystin-dependent protein
MAEPFVGEIRMFGGNFAPDGWAFCDGATLQIAQYDVLYTLIGTTYGGNGIDNFKLPDLRARVPVHQGTRQGTTYGVGQPGGTETVSLTSGQMPAHSHTLVATTAPGTTAPTGALFAATSSSQPGTSVYGTGSASLTTLSPQSIQSSGNGVPHSNIQPYLCITFIIALFGVYPSQN